MTTDKRIVYTTAFWNSVGFLLGTVPPMLIDPGLEHHVLYPCRHYHHTWLVYVAACAVPLLTIVAGSRAKGRNRAMLLNIPFLAICLPMFAIFLPEFPHVNLLFVFTVTLVLSTATVFIHDLSMYDARIPEMDKSALIDLIKEDISLWKTVCLGLAFAWLGGLVAIVAEFHTANSYLLQNYAPEVTRVNQVSYVMVVYISLYTFFGPIYECAAKIGMSIDKLKGVKPAGKRVLGN